MLIPPKLPVEIVKESVELDSAIRAMSFFPAIAMDTESNSFFHYPEQLCLIQIATPDRVYLIDTIILKDLSSLGKILAEAAIEKVIHGADYDVRSLDRHGGIRIHNLYDTSIAARFAGMTHFGLSALIEDLLHVTITKSKRLQRANWGLRPLSAEAIDYASTDVRYLFALRDILDKRLASLGRTAWVAEECARLEEVKYNPLNLETAYFSLDGARNLDGRGLAVLRSLHLFRENEARRQQRPPFFIIPDPALVYLAASPATPLPDVPGLGQIGAQRYGRGIRQALSDGQDASPVHRPPSVLFERMNSEQERRLNRFKDWRASLAAALCLDPSLLWPTPSLERLAREPDTFEVELNSATIRRWQYEQFAASLRTCLESR